MPGRPLRVTALVPYVVDTAAGQRFRIELWAKRLAQRGFVVELLPFCDAALQASLWQKGDALGKALGLVRCYGRQLARIAAAQRPDVFFVYREAALVGPAILEQLVRLWRAPIVYDLDEPLFLPYASPHSGAANRLRFFSKISSVAQLADQVLVVNEALASWARQHCRRVAIVPMAVDTERYRPCAAPPPSPLRIGWVGTRTSQKNLAVIAEPIARLCRSHGAVLRVIADEPMTLPGVEVEFLPWAFATEVAQLQECHIGIVPVLRDEWCDWKFYFKLVQLMALGIPVVAAPIGSNNEIVRSGENGFLADGHDAWYSALAALADDAALRRRLGEAGHQTAAERFSLDAQIDQIEPIFRELSR